MRLIVTRTPLRISFFGGGTDLPNWTAGNEGACLSATIDKFIWLTLRRRPPHAEGGHLLHLRPENPANQVVSVILSHYGFPDRVEMTCQADLPPRSGMGTSSAFTVGFLHALSALRGEIISKAELAHQAVLVEQKVLHEFVGSQDQHAASHGGLNLYRFVGTEVSVQPLPAPRDVMRALNDRLLLFDIGPRPCGVTGSSVTAKYQPKDHHLRTLASMVDSALRMIAANALDDLGRLLGDAWELKRELGGISDDRIDSAYRKALTAGALGGKLLGAGLGGHMLIYSPLDRQDGVRESVGLRQVPFEFERQGSQILLYAP